MNIFRSRFLMVAGLAGTAGLLMNVNCSSGGGGGTGGTGGTTSTGGKGGTGTGGTSTGGKGGTTATGGGAGTTSTGGTGGTTSTGGTAGSGTGGSAGAKGGNGGANTDGGTQFAAFSYTFDTQAEGTEGWGFNTGDKPTDGSTNLSITDAGTPPSLTWDGAVGDPTAGSLEIQAMFSGYRQFVQVAVANLSLTVDPTGRTAQAWVMLDKQDGGTALPVGAQLEFNSGANYSGFAGTSYTALTPGTWTKLTLPLAKSSSFDPSQIIQIAVQFITESQPDGGAAFGSPIHATFHVDTVTDGSGLSLTPPVDYTFDVNTEGFAAGAFGSVPDGGAAPTVTFDSTIGDPNPGSLEATLPFTAYGQTYAVDATVTPPADLSGKTIHAKVMLDKVDGGDPAFTQSGYVKVFAQGTGFKYAAGTATGLTAGVWTDFTMNVSTPVSTTTGYDPTQIIQVGVQFGINNMPDGGVFGSHEAPVFHIDSIVAQ